MKMGRTAAVMGAFALLLTACGGGELAEQIIESQEGVGDIEIDESSGTVVVEIEDEEGDASISIGGGEIPDDFPVPVPEGGTVQSVVTMDTGASLSMLFPSDEFESLKDFYSSWASGESDDVTTFESSNPKAASWTFRDGQTEYVVSLADVGGTGVSLSIVVTS
jgi:hypothetical protein